MVSAVLGFLAYHANSYVARKKERVANEKVLFLEAENKRLDTARLQLTNGQETLNIENKRLDTARLALENGQTILEKNLEEQKQKTAEAEKNLLAKVQELAVSQKQVEYLQLPRRLSENEKSSILKYLRGVKTDDTKIQFLSSMGSEEVTYLDDFRAVFKQAGWNVGIPAVFPTTTMGITIVIPVRNKTYKSYSSAVESALKNANIPFQKTYTEAIDDNKEDGQNWGDAPTLQIGQKSYTRLPEL